MRSLLAAAVVGFAFAASPLAYAQTSTTTTSTVTAICKDGSSFSGASKRGACSGHGGVRTWGAASPGTAATAAPTTTPAPASTTSHPQTTQKTAPAAGGGAGQVWVNTSSKVYHCPGDRYYGKTKQGQYMTESAARAAGDRPSNNKTCS
ncbi:MAG TPA: hypothetical protein VN702_20240 [Acetobacteraceae bacterium]|nr:hypothetical protein [Acetobacteraceae bacterium]